LVTTPIPGRRRESVAIGEQMCGSIVAVRRTDAFRVSSALVAQFGHHGLHSFTDCTSDHPRICRAHR
jgi:hypothetical protein